MISGARNHLGSICTKCQRGAKPRYFDPRSSWSLNLEESILIFFYQVRQEVKEENEVLAKKRAQQKRRNARADNRVEAAGGGDEEAQVKEQLFRLLLVDNCPRF